MVFDRDRYAYELNTLPKYIYVDSEGKVDNFEYVLTQIDPTDVLKVYTATNATAIEKMDLTVTDIVLPFVVFNQKFHTVMRDLKGDMFFVANALDLSEEVSKAIASIWSDISDQREYEIMMSGVDVERRQFRQEYEARVAEKQVFTTAQPFEAGASLLSSVNNVYTFERKTSLLGLFDSIELSPSLYLASTTSYYKILNKTSYALEYPDTDNKLFLFLKGTRIVIEGTGDPAKPVYTLTVPEVPVGFEMSDLRRILKVSKLELTGQRLNLSIDFYSPNLLTFELNKTIWADLIMNNAFLSDKFIIDEHLKPTRSSDSIYMFWLKEGRKTAFILSSYTGLDAAKTKYLTKITAKLLNSHEDEFEEFKRDLSSTLGVYMIMAEQLASEYNKYLGVPIRLKKPVDEGDKQLRLKDIEPDMFISGYTRACQFMPSIVDDATARSLKRDGFEIMEFPLIDIDGETRSYSCALNKTHIYPGLRVNRLPNKDKYPYLPCCFRQNQFVKNSTYNKYLKEQEGKEDAVTRDDEDVPTGKGFIITDKILKLGQTGDPPLKLKKLFSLYTDAPVIRLGTLKSSSSILECILTIKQGEAFTKLRVRDKVALLQRERRILSKLSDNYFSLIGQETWNIGRERAREILADGAQYLDPRIFYTLLEYYYDCRLVLFSKNDFIRPNCNANFVSYASNSDIVVAYENYGGEAEYTTIPQLEMFSPIADISERIYALYRSSFASRAVDDRGIPHLLELLPVQLEPFTPSRIHSQILDFSGKATALNVYEAGEIVTFILKTPLAPLPVADTLATYHSSKLPKRSLYQLYVQYGGRNYIIEDASPSAFDADSDSWLAEYVTLEKTSRLLIEKAKRAASKGERVDINPRVKYSDLEWPARLAVKNVATKERLEYSTELFEKYKLAEFVQYRNYVYAPNQFVAPYDFTNRHNEIVSSTQTLVRWTDSSKILEVKPIVSKKSFFLELASTVYHCIRIKVETTLPENCVCAIWNTKTILKVGSIAKGQAYISFLIYKTRTGVELFRCFPVVRN